MQRSRNSIIEHDLKSITSTALPWRTFEGRKVLVSGASGLLPAYMVEVLLYLNETAFSTPTKVIGLVRDIDKAHQRFINYVGREDIEIIAHDVCEPIGIDLSPDFIIHAASHASPIYYGADPVGTMAPNVLGTSNLLKLARRSNVECFMFFSTGEVYGNTDHSSKVNENTYGPLDPTNVRSCYAESKRMGETMCAAYAHQYGVPFKVVRPFHTYGPGMRLDDGRVFADFVANIVRDEDIVLKSDGRARRAFCYIADSTLGFFTVLLKGEMSGIYNIGNDAEEVSILELASLLVGLFPEKKLKVIRDVPETREGYMRSPVSRHCPDISKARALGWNPMTTLQDGFRKTVLSYTEK